MYTKCFRSIYDGSLADNWRALVTFQNLLILADAQGVVDMSVNAIHRQTGIPLDILEPGIAALEAPDALSRTPTMEGRRIILIDDHRSWGWRVVNFLKYRAIVNKESKNEADRLRIKARRASEDSKLGTGAEARTGDAPAVADVATCSATSPNVADVAHTYTEEEEEEKSREVDIPRGAAFPSVQAADVGLACRLMKAAGCARVNPSNAALIAAIAEGVSPQVLADYATEAIESGIAQPFPYAISAARGNHAAGARTGAPTHAASLRHRESTADASERKAREGDERDRLRAEQDSKLVSIDGEVVAFEQSERVTAKPMFADWSSGR